MKKAINIQDNFGDYILSCPYCKKPIIFSFNRTKEKKIIKCYYCNKKIKL